MPRYREEVEATFHVPEPSCWEVENWLSEISTDENCLSGIKRSRRIYLYLSSEAGVTRRAKFTRRATGWRVEPSMKRYVIRSGTMVKLEYRTKQALTLDSFLDGLDRPVIGAILKTKSRIDYAIPDTHARIRISFDRLTTCRLIPEDQVHRYYDLEFELKSGEVTDLSKTSKTLLPATLQDLTEIAEKKSTRAAFSRPLRLTSASELERLLSSWYHAE